jgi:hypothetical protein
MTALAPTPPTRTPARVAAIISGSLLALVAAALIVAGGFLLWADLTQRGSDGWLTSSFHRFDTPTRALTAEELDLGDLPAARAPDLGDVRVRARAAGGGPVFVGIAPQARVDAYLRGVAHAEVTDVRGHGYDVTVRPGGRVPVAPADARIWSAAASGPGTQTARWSPSGGKWAIVVMNAGGGRGVHADVQVGARAPWLLAVALGVLGAGALIGLLASLLVVLGLEGTLARPAVAEEEPAPAGEEPPAHPVTVTARLDEPLSRWLWLVKWILVIPHAIVLAFLWAAFLVLTLVALVAILFTGRYPRSLFDFNVGVLRWTWRVGFYANSALATDRYPPFTLGPADYPADLHVPYPERLSRWKVLFKSWLFAIPHYFALTALIGGWNTRWAMPGLLGVLVAVAAVLLLVRGRYPRDVFKLVVGINRWALRVVSYVALMRDEYPPFRLDR